MKSIAELAKSLREPVSLIPVADIREAADVLFELCAGREMSLQSDVEWLRHRAKYGGGERYDNIADSIELMREEIANLVKALQDTMAIARQADLSIQHVACEAIGIENE